MKKDSDYLGVECISIYYGEEIPVYVAQCDRTQGATLHSLEDNRMIACINRQEILKIFRMDDKEDQYNALFDELLRQIDQGEVSNFRIDMDGWSCGPEKGDNHLTCAFA